MNNGDVLFEAADFEAGADYVLVTRAPGQHFDREHRLGYLGPAGMALQFAAPVGGTVEIRPEWIRRMVRTDRVPSLRYVNLRA
jgi:hypothetical protein